MGSLLSVMVTQEPAVSIAACGVVQQLNCRRFVVIVYLSSVSQPVGDMGWGYRLGTLSPCLLMRGYICVDVQTGDGVLFLGE